MTIKKILLVIASIAFASMSLSAVAAPPAEPRFAFVALPLWEPPPALLKKGQKRARQRTIAAILDHFGDITEGILFSLGAGDYHSKEKIMDELAYRSPQPDERGNCLNDDPCLVALQKRLQLEHLIVAIIPLTSADADPYRFTIKFVANGTITTVEEQSDRDDVALQNKIYMTVTIALAQKKPVTLIVTVEPFDAHVEVGGVPLPVRQGNQPAGTSTMDVKPGRYTVRAIKDGYKPLEKMAICEPTRACAVTLALERLEQRKDPIIRDPIGPISADFSNVKTPLIITGWSVAAVGAALAIVGAVKYRVARDLEDEVHAACATEPCSLTEEEARNKEADGEDAIAVWNYAGIPGIVLFGAGIATAIVGHALPVQPIISPTTAGMTATLHF